VTIPDVPHRIEFSIDVPGTPQQVWDAIATAGGLSAWFLPTQLEERLGGAVLTEMGEGQTFPATITGWDPPHRLAYEEPEWMLLAGQPRDAEVSALATEFLVEARSGGTCVVHIVSSAFGTGADWENEFFDGMADGWLSFFGGLRSYLAHFAGQQAVTFAVDAKVSGAAAQVRDAMAARLGIDAVGQHVDIDGRTAVVDQTDSVLLVRLTAPHPGLLRFWSWEDDGCGMAQVMGYLFGDAGADDAERERRAWSEWLGTLEVPA
jgi:uncharacterized protein YndB with AHSA1/START domain